MIIESFSSPLLTSRNCYRLFFLCVFFSFLNWQNDRLTVVFFPLSSALFSSSHIPAAPPLSSLSPSLPKSSCPSSLFLPDAIIFSTFISPPPSPLCNPLLPAFTSPSFPQIFLLYICHPPPPPIIFSLSSCPHSIICFPSFHTSLAAHPPPISPITHFLFLNPPRSIHLFRLIHFPSSLFPPQFHHHIKCPFFFFHSALCGLCCDVDPGRLVPAPPPLPPGAEPCLPGGGHP